MATISDRVKRLLADHVESVAQLEVLLLLQGHDDRLWTPAEVARRLKTQPDLAEATLAKLARVGIARVEHDDAGQPAFAYGPGSRETRSGVDELARSYATHKTTVISLIFSKPSDAIQDLADPFRFRSNG